MTIEPLEARIAPAALTLTVTTLKDSGPGSLRDALTTLFNNPSTDQNTITFKSGLHGKITLLSALPVISDNLALTGPGSNRLTIDGHDLHEIFSISYNGVNSSPAITISGLTLSHGSAQAGGAVLVNATGATVTLDSCVLSHNQAVGANGNGTNGYLGKGGAIDLEAGTLTLSKTTISGNIAKGGTAGASYTGGQAMGGGIYVAQYANLSLANSTITGNKALGGIGLAGAKGAPGVKGSASQASGYGGNGYNGGYGGNAYGGAVFNLGTTTIQTSVVSGNTATGGVGGSGGNGGEGGHGFSGHGVEYAGGNGGNGGNSGNAGNAAGGGLLSGGSSANLVSQASLTIQNSTVTGNTAVAGVVGKAGVAGAAGAGVVHQGGSTYRGVKGYAGSKGTAGTSTGGGVYSYSGYLTLSQVKVGKNKAQQTGSIDINQKIAAAANNSVISITNVPVQSNNGSFESGGTSIVLLSQNFGPALAPDIVGTVSGLNAGTGLMSPSALMDAVIAYNQNLASTQADSPMLEAVTAQINQALLASQNTPSVTATEVAVVDL